MSISPIIKKANEEHIRTMSSAGLHAFFNISNDWCLTTEEEFILIGEPSLSRFLNWKQDPISVQLSRDILERISYILGIYKALQLLLPSPSSSDEWVRKANQDPLFSGKSALDKMLSGNLSDLCLVRQYLDAFIYE